MKKFIIIFLTLFWSSISLANNLKIVDGDTIILNGEKVVNCNKYDSTFCPSNTQHELINETDEEVHAIIIYGSVDVNRTFSKTGLTVLIGSKEDNFTDKQ